MRRLTPQASLCHVLTQLCTHCRRHELLLRNCPAASPSPRVQVVTHRDVHPPASALPPRRRELSDGSAAVRGAASRSGTFSRRAPACSNAWTGGEWRNRARAQTAEAAFISVSLSEARAIDLQRRPLQRRSCGEEGSGGCVRPVANIGANKERLAGKEEMDELRGAEAAVRATIL